MHPRKPQAKLASITVDVPHMHKRKSSAFCAGGSIDRPNPVMFGGRQPCSEPDPKPKKNIWVAAGDGDLGAVQYYLRNGLTVNAADEFGYTPLYVIQAVMPLIHS